ncbi:hypothetical protein T08_14616 [Trichinella sp. T8]|nr:hypothetical protein T08_14616 [Trichinella sp. T8]
MLEIRLVAPGLLSIRTCSKKSPARDQFNRDASKLSQSQGVPLLTAFYYWSLTALLYKSDVISNAIPTAATTTVINNQQRSSTDFPPDI